MIPIATNTDIKKLKAKYSHLDFMRYCWQKPQEPLIEGLHTREICRLYDEAVENLRQGKSTFLVIKVHFRAGKSDILSRFAPPHFIGEFPDKDVMVVGYNSSLAEGFSRFGRSLMRSPEYASLYPNNVITGGVQSWGVEGHNGVVTASGLTSGITGKGYSLGICDDYCASRAEAESETIRNSTWEHFTNDFLTRRSPASITIVLATPWHIDDIIGRIERKIDPKSEEYDPNFPPFKVVSFPAKNGEVDIGVKDYAKYGDRKTHMEHIKYEYLFPERFNADWYTQQFASLGEYASASLLQCSPTIRGGNLIDTSKIKIHNSLADFPMMKYYRIWDLAHTAKQRLKDDPDWTSGTLLGFRNVGGVWELWVRDVAHFRASAPDRNNLMYSIAEKDGGAVSIGVETSLDAKDTIATMQLAMRGRRRILPIVDKGDKVARMSYLEPLFEAGNVHILRADWNYDWLNEIREFPNGKHDDQVDNLSAGYNLICMSHQQMERVRVAGV